MASQVQRRTFYLLVCERCGHSAEAPEPFEAPDFAAPTAQPMRCQDCGELLLLAECFLAPQTTMWQSTPGALWQHVIFPEALPAEKGRQVWMNA